MTKNPTVRPEHLAEVFTEIRMRKDVYPRRIAERLMTQVHEVLMWLHENKKPADSPYPPGICGLSAHIKELKTELNWRDRVYNRKVLLGQMKPEERDLKIRLVEEVKVMLEQMQAHNLAVQTSLF